MPRTQIRLVVRNANGVAQSGATVSFFRDDGTTPYGTLYAAPAGGSPVTTHTTNALGLIERWGDADNPRRVKATVTGLADQVNTQAAIDPAVQLYQSMPAVVTLDGYTGTGWAQTIKSAHVGGGVASQIARFLDSNDVPILRLWRSTGGNLAASINLLNDTIPTLNTLEVRKASGTTGFILTEFELQASAGGIVQATLHGIGKQTVSGISNVVGVRGTAERSGSASATGSARGIEGRIKTTVAGSVAGGYNAAVAALTDVITSGVSPDAWYYAGGAGALPTYVLYAESSASAQLFSISSTGVTLGGNGAVGTPAYAFVSDPDTGLYRVGANILGLAAGGTVYLQVDHGNTRLTAKAIVPEANATYELGSVTNNWSIVRSRFLQSGPGDAAGPSITFDGDTNTGVFQQAADTIGISTGGTERLRLGTLLDFRGAAMSVALGGGAAPTLGTIGGSGPATAGQHSWLAINIGGTASYLPVWR